MRNGLDGLKALLGVSASTTPQSRQTQRSSSPGAGDLAQDQATVSSAGTEALRGTGEADVRMEKVVAVQAAMAAGTYSVPASEVASKVIDSMLVAKPSGE
ncbi:MAG: flagellar biosynthesis anti-sigma factor FlgM [Terracidiphilus sp.]